jgi:hypothetical protein
VAGSFWQVVKAQKYTHGCDNARFEMVVFLWFSKGRNETFLHVLRLSKVFPVFHSQVKSRNVRRLRPWIRHLKLSFVSFYVWFMLIRLAVGVVPGESPLSSSLGESFLGKTRKNKTMLRVSECAQWFLSIWCDWWPTPDVPGRQLRQTCSASQSAHVDHCSQVGTESV